MLAIVDVFFPKRCHMRGLWESECSQNAVRKQLERHRHNTCTKGLMFRIISADFFGHLMFNVFYYSAVLLYRTWFLVVCLPICLEDPEDLESLVV